MIVALLCRDCHTVFDYKIKNHWERIVCGCCGSKEISMRTIPENRKDLTEKFYHDKEV
jgi:hypothetical protein